MLKPTLLLALACGSLVLAQMAPTQQRLEGVWIVTVTRVNPPANLPPTFLSLQQYLPNGGYQETSNSGRTNRGPALGEWVRTGDRQFTITQYHFRFGANEQFAGTTRIVRNIRLSEDGKEFAGVSTQDQFDAEGRQTATGVRATEAGKRGDLGELADKP